LCVPGPRTRVLRTPLCTPHPKTPANTSTAVHSTQKPVVQYIKTCQTSNCARTRQHASSVAAAQLAILMYCDIQPANIQSQLYSLLTCSPTGVKIGLLINNGRFIRHQVAVKTGVHVERHTTSSLIHGTGWYMARVTVAPCLSPKGHAHAHSDLHIIVSTH
jgi:hypothetical protein